MPSLVTSLYKSHLDGRFYFTLHHYVFIVRRIVCVLFFAQVSSTSKQQNFYIFFLTLALLFNFSVYAKRWNNKLHLSSRKQMQSYIAIPAAEKLVLMIFRFSFTGFDASYKNKSLSVADCHSNSMLAKIFVRVYR